MFGIGGRTRHRPVRRPGAVVAVADGRCSVGYNGLGGWRLWLRDGAGTAFYFAHLSAFAPAAREGASVA
jgi:hypothetical protein